MSDPTPADDKTTEVPIDSTTSYYLVNQCIHWGQLGIKAVDGAVGFVPVFESRMAANIYRLTLENAGDYKVEKWRKCNE